jgi:hypothetical protein
MFILQKSSYALTYTFVYIAHGWQVVGANIMDLDVS